MSKQVTIEDVKDDILSIGEFSKDALLSAKKNLQDKLFRTAAQQSQIVIELSAKAIISCFTEDEWKHDISNQLAKIIEGNNQKIMAVLGEDFVKDLQILVEDVYTAAPWHGKTIYGFTDNFGRTIKSAVKICTEDIAKDLLVRAERSYTTAEKFIIDWFKI